MKVVIAAALTLLVSISAANAKLEGKVSNSRSKELGMIGVRISSLSKTISKVMPNSPADIYGLKVGDVIVDVDSNHSAALEKIDGNAYEYVKLTIKRNKEIKTINVFRFEKSSIDWNH